jgi:hypothetical protein
MRAGRIPLVLIGAVFASMSIAKAASGAILNQGMNYISSSCCTLRATKVGIVAPTSADFFLQSGVAALESVRSESCTSITGCSSGGLMQVGLLEALTNVDGGTCPSSSGLHQFFESRPMNGSFTCGYVRLVSGGDSSNYVVWRRPTGATTWAGFIRGSLVISQDVGYDAAGLIAAGGEISCGTCSSTPPSHPWAYFGGNGLELWQRSSVAGGGSWFTIQQANKINTDGGWTIESVPNPFHVSH